jgi:hypothetical protein
MFCRYDTALLETHLPRPLNQILIMYLWSLSMMRHRFLSYVTVLLFRGWLAGDEPCFHAGFNPVLFTKPKPPGAIEILLVHLLVFHSGHRVREHRCIQVRVVISQPGHNLFRGCYFSCLTILASSLNDPLLHLSGLSSRTVSLRSWIVLQLLQVIQTAGSARSPSS